MEQDEKKTIELIKSLE
jgi:hypothetical protein